MDKEEAKKAAKGCLFKPPPAVLLGRGAVPAPCEIAAGFVRVYEASAPCMAKQAPWIKVSFSVRGYGTSHLIERAAGCSGWWLVVQGW